MQLFILIMTLLIGSLATRGAVAACPDPCSLEVSVNLNPPLECLVITPPTDFPSCICLIEVGIDNECDEEIGIEGLVNSMCIGPDGSSEPSHCNPLVSNARGLFTHWVPREDGDGAFTQSVVMTTPNNTHTLSLNYTVAFEEQGGCATHTVPLPGLVLLVAMVIRKRQKTRHQV